VFMMAEKVRDSEVRASTSGVATVRIQAGPGFIEISSANGHVQVATIMIAPTNASGVTCNHLVHF
jgi:hypothetical protein